MSRFLTLFKRKLVLIPVLLVLATAAVVWGIDRRLMRAEAEVFEIGSGIRSLLDDYTGDFLVGDRATISDYYAADYTGGDLGFENRQQISSEGGIVLEDWSARPGVLLDREQTVDQLIAYRESLVSAKTTKFKMVYLKDFTGDTANILMRFQVYAKQSEGRLLEDRGHFQVGLERRQGSWRIVSQTLENARRAIGPESPYFVDVSQEAGIDFSTGQPSPIFEHLKFNFAIVNRAAGGVTSGDYDLDGYPDLFMTGFAGSKLYRNLGDGTFSDVTEAAGLGGETTKYGQGCLFADYDNDGDLDLFITKTPGVKREDFFADYPLDSAEKMSRIFELSPDRIAALFERSEDETRALLKGSADQFRSAVDDLIETWILRLSHRLIQNQGDGTFRDVTEQSGLLLTDYGSTSAFADVDNDGDLDLYVGLYGSAKNFSPDPPFHARRGRPNRLFLNDGHGKFRDVSEGSGAADSGWTLGLTFLDYDNDGDQDIYTANDFGYNSLLENDGQGHFRFVSKQAGTLDYGFGMSASPGDYDNDGDLDLYVSNVYSGTTWYLQHTIFQYHWVRLVDLSRTWQATLDGLQIYSLLGGLRGIGKVGQKLGEGNSLLENQGDGTFKSVGIEKGVQMAGWAWGSNFFDFDNDGDLDVHSVNGWISNKPNTDL